MLKIGEFSKISQVSIKALRYYDHIGLLKPVHIDRFNGYRYYTLAQLPLLNRILALKDLDFSLDQIKELIQLDLTQEAFRNLLQNKARELRQRILDDHSRLVRLEDRLNQLIEGNPPNPNPVVLKSSPPYLVATIRHVVPSLHALPTWKDAQIERILGYLDQLGQSPEGPEVLIYHQDEFVEVDIDVEVGLVVRQAFTNAESGPSMEDIRLYTLANINHLATIIHSPPVSAIKESYANLAHWAQANGFQPIGPWRELTYTQNEPFALQVIEVQRPVMKAITFYSQLEIKEMEPKIITRPAFSMVGLRYFGKNEHGEISKLWEVFNQRMKDLNGLPHATGEAAFGLCTTPDDETAEGGFEYVAGFPVHKVKDVPEGFVVRHVPEYTYAVFPHKGDLPSLGKTYEYIYETWLPQSGYQLADNIDFEYYNEDFKYFSSDSVLYIYVPIKKG